MSTRRLYFALDLKSDATLIAEYEAWHRPERIWREIPEFLRAAGIVDLEIFRCGDRLVMAMEVPEGFSAARHAELAKANDRVKAWEELMWRFQQPLPCAASEKWVPMSRIFSLEETLRGKEPGQ
ncbi:MAG: L-rhamnose mutarotase [Steroidobacteraceae bacterium]|jgi:L-rhamnose mutarotase